jgi:Galactose oxidase, central domain
MKASLILPVFLLGVAGHSPLAQAQSSGTFTPTASMGTARSFHTATLLLDGRVLIAGGGNDSGPAAAVSGTEIYDPVRQTFTPSGDMNARRSGHTATLLPDGRVLIVGGDGVGSAELYDPSTGSFSTTGSVLMARNGFNATLLKDGKVGSEQKSDRP